MSVTEET